MHHRATGAQEPGQNDEAQLGRDTPHIFSPLETKQLLADDYKKLFRVQRIITLILLLIVLCITITLAGLAIFAAAERKKCPKYSTQPSTWVKITPSGKTPSPRLSHAAAGIGSIMYMHGGFYGNATVSTTYDDLWSYDETIDTWTQIRTSGDIPSGRLHHSFVDTDSRTILMFGGFNVFAGPTHTSYNDFYELNLDTRVWTRLDTLASGPAPTRRGSHDCIWADGAMYLYGGFAKIGGTPLAELYKYVYSTKTWYNLTVVNSAATPFPSGRIGFAFTIVNDLAILIGGACTDGPDGQCNDMWSYNWVTNVWAKIDAKNPPPPRRATNADVAVFGVLYLYGGVYVNGTQQYMYDDMYALDPDRAVWMPVYPNFGRGEQPPKTFGHSLIRLGNNIVLFGGRIGAPTSMGSNNLWEFHTIAPV